jgi:predicted aspartyl protease
MSAQTAFMLSARGVKLASVCMVTAARAKRSFGVGQQSSGTGRSYGALQLLVAMQLVVVSLGILLLLPGCSRATSDSPAFKFDGDEVRIPMRMVNGLPVVEVRVNGKGPYRFVLDSGSGYILVSRRIIDEAALPASTNVVKAYDEAGRSYSAETYLAERIELGSARLNRITVVRGFDWFDPTQGIQGILGVTYFAGCNVRLDFPRQTVTLERPKWSHKHPDQGLPMEMDRSCPYVNLRIGTTTHRFAIDTGLNAGLTVRESLITNLPCCAERYAESRGVAGGKQYLCYRTRLKDNLEIGAHTVVRPYISWIPGVPGVPTSMLGNEILRHFALEFDFPEHRVRFLRDTTEPIRTPNRRQLGFVLNHSTNAVVTIQLLLPPFTAAELGVKTGDEVVMLDGKPAAEVNNDAVAAMIQKDQLLIILRRDGVLLTNTVPVQEDRFTFGEASRASDTFTGPRTNRTLPSRP